MKEFDLVILGAGPGGYVAAIKGAQEGLKVAVIEANHLGGICLNWGCIPTKSLLNSTSMLDNMKHHTASAGITFDNLSIDTNVMFEKSRKVSKQLAGGVGVLLKKNKVEVIDGYGRFVDSTTLEVDLTTGGKQLVKAKDIIIATGSRARTLPFLPMESDKIWTYKNALAPTEIPKSLLILGSGAIGIEFANVYNSLGVDVTVLEALPLIMPQGDKDISKSAEKNFISQGIKIKTNAMLQTAEINGDGNVVASVKVGDDVIEMEASHLLCAVGVVPNTGELCLENTNVELDERGYVCVNEYLKTDDKNIWAIGDIIGNPCLAHKASHEGIHAVDHIIGDHIHEPIQVENIPTCIYTNPQVASIGLTEEQASKRGHALRVGKFPFIGNGKAVASNHTDGFIKSIFDADTGELLGMHMFGSGVTELFGAGIVAKQLETTEVELMSTIFPHPTMSEAIHESILDAYGKVIHM